MDIMSNIQQSDLPTSFVELGEFIAGRFGMPLEEALMRLLELEERCPEGSLERALSL